MSNPAALPGFRRQCDEAGRGEVCSTTTSFADLAKYVGGSAARQGTGIYQTADEVAEVVLECVASDAPPVRVRIAAVAEALCASSRPGFGPRWQKKPQAQIMRNS
jgi:hypothetical protein